MSRFHFLPALAGIFLAISPLANARTVIYVGGANTNQATNDEWARQFQAQNPDDIVMAFRGPNCVAHSCAGGDKKLLEEIHKAVKEAGDDEIELVAHSSGSAPVERVLYDPAYRSKKIKMYSLDGFPPGARPEGVKHEVVCVTGLLRLKNGQVGVRAKNYDDMYSKHCSSTYPIEFSELDTNSTTADCLHHRMINENACSKLPALRNTFVLETKYMQGDPSVAEAPASRSPAEQGKAPVQRAN